MREETRLFLGAVFQEDRSILDFIDGRFTFVNGPLARYYGITGVDGEAFQRVELDGEQRSGILTQGVDLSVDLVVRDAHVAGAARQVGARQHCSGRRRLRRPTTFRRWSKRIWARRRRCASGSQQHRANPSCAACHDSMDPIGFGLENYDAAGAWRTKDGNFDIDSAGTLPDGRDAGRRQGTQAGIREHDRTSFVEHFTDRLMTYALGRGLEQDRSAGHPADFRRIRAQHDYRFSALVTSIVNSRPFQMRSRVTADDHEAAVSSNRAARPGRRRRAAVPRRDVSPRSPRRP